MIKKYLLVFLLLSSSVICTAQSLSVRAINNSGNSNTSTFNLEKGNVSLGSSQIRFQQNNKIIEGYLAYGVSQDQSVLAVLNGRDAESRVTVFNTSGDTLSSFEVASLSAGDPSIAVYPASTGALLVRDNIANFNFYDSFGEIITNLSGSSQSTGGEAISEVAINSTAETVIIYTPKIKSGNKLGSQAQYVNREMSLKSLFHSTDRYIKNLSVTDNGQFVVFITSRKGTDDEIHVTDRFGNELASISSDENLVGAHLSENAGYVTAFSGKRVLIFNTLTKERIGSTSFRSKVVKVDYFPEDNTILALTGDYEQSTGIISNVEFHAINVNQRKVERKDYNSALGFNKALSSGFVRLGKNRYRFTGANKTLELQVSF